MGLVHRVWRRFRPAAVKSRARPVGQELFAEVERELAGIIRTYSVARWRKFDVSRLDATIEQRRRAAELSGAALDWVVVLVLQAPRSAIAQRNMDRHPHGFNGRQARLYELIDFNDSFVSAVLSLPEEHLPHFQTELKRMMDRFCARLRSPVFTDEQYEAITHGLSREIAVYRGALREGLLVRMTSRAEDARGVDMVITDPVTNRSVNVDIKTRSAYYYRLKDLHRDGRISAELAAQAEIQGYCEVKNDHGADAVNVVLVRIDAEEVGEIASFGFTDTKRVGEMLRRVIAAHGVTIETGKVGEYAS